MKFNYKSQTKAGSFTEGIIEAADMFVASRIIRERGEVPLSVKEYREKRNLNVSFEKVFGRVTLHEKIMFARNLSGMLSAGLSLYRALEVLRKQSKNNTFNQALDILLADVSSGGTLSSGMQKLPKIFSSLFVSMIRAGEESGNLPTTLKEISINLEKTYVLNKKIKGALVYPAIILIAIVVIAIFMLIFVVPTLTKTFTELNVELPMSTQVVIFISDLFSQHTAALAIIILGLIVGGYFLSKLSFIKNSFDYLIVRLPVIGVIVKEVNSARTARTLSSLLAAGVDITRALSITKEVLQNIYYKKVIDQTIESVQKGIPISKALKEHLDLYPVMVGEMVEVGEETGKLMTMLGDIATFYEDEVDAKTKNLSTIIEPMLMIVIGAAVGFFAVSMITPMYSLMDSIK